MKKIQVHRMRNGVYWTARVEIPECNGMIYRRTSDKLWVILPSTVVVSSFARLGGPAHRRLKEAVVTAILRYGSTS